MSQLSGKYLFVINPIAGDTDKSQLPEQIHKTCEKYAVAFDKIETTGEDDQQTIRETIDSFAPDTVVACGGDGTISLVAKLLLNTDITLGIIPLGSANGLASELNITYSPDADIDYLFAGETRAMDSITINGEHLCLHLSDLGFNARLIKDFEEQEGRGMLGYARAFFESLKKKESRQYIIKSDQNKEPKQVEADMLVIANARSYGTGAVINPKGSISDGFMELVIVKPIPPSAWPSITFDTFFGSIEKSEYVQIIKGTSFEITCDEQEVLQVDGELIGKRSKVTAHMQKHALHIIIPGGT